MNITIIGWYGTETTGDRAILAGIFRTLSHIYKEFDVKLGALFPPLSQRTILQDSEFFLQCSDNCIRSFEVFDTLSPSELKSYVNKSDLLMIGGGPLMDIPQMYMLDHAFKLANKRGIPAIVMGCGVGPLNTDEYKSVTASIFKKADRIILRDSNSLEKLRTMMGENTEAVSAIDPAVFAADFYNKSVKNTPTSEESYIAINFRDMALDPSYGHSEAYEQKFCDLVQAIANAWEYPVHLVPMHTFDIGGDDREILTRIWLKLGAPDQIKVEQKPLSLVETMKLYKNAKICIGMRFHAVLLQTILNGSNYVLDYTDAQNGKIQSLIKDLGIGSDLEHRYVSLLKGNLSTLNLTSPLKKISISDQLINQKMSIYIDSLKSLKN